MVTNCGRVEISLRKEVPHQQWEDIGEFLNGHCRLTHKTKRGTWRHIIVHPMWDTLKKGRVCFEFGTLVKLFSHILGYAFTHSQHGIFSADTKYHSSSVESIKSITHDTKLYTLRLPAGSYLNVPTGHHLSVKAQVNGESANSITRSHCCGWHLAIN